MTDDSFTRRKMWYALLGRRSWKTNFEDCWKGPRYIF